MSSFIKRPFRSEEKTYPNGNIFKSLEQVHLPAIKQLAKTEDKSYHLVGPSQLRTQILAEQFSHQHPHGNDRLQSLDRLEQRRSLPELTPSMNTTVLRESMLSKLGKHEQKAFTREKRNLQFYKDYQQFWQDSSKRFRASVGGGTQPTLLEGSVKRLLVMPNPQKEQLLKNYVNTYWQMSLRNNNYILKRHIKGENRYDQKKMEEMLQCQQGTKLVEMAIPKLPIESLRQANHRQFTLTGRNKLACESASCDPSIVSQYTSRLSKAMTDGAALDRNQEILKMNYDSSHNFLKEQHVN